MSKKGDEGLIVGLDIGTSKVLAIVGEVSSSGEVEVIGVGHHPSRGMKKGVVVNIDGALDPVAVGAQVERILQQYTSVTGRPLQVVTR